MKKFLLLSALFMFALNLSAQTTTITFLPLQEFFKAAEEGDMAKMEEFVKEYNIDINARDYRNRTAKIIAARNGHIKIVEFLSEVESKQRLEVYVGKKFTNDENLVRTVLEKFIKDIKQNNYDVPPHVLAVFARRENWDFMEKASASFPEFYESIKSLVDRFFEAGLKEFFDEANTSDLENPFTKTNLQEIQNEFIKKGETLKLVGRLVGR